MDRELDMKNTPAAIAAITMVCGAFGVPPEVLTQDETAKQQYEAFIKANGQVIVWKG